MGANSIHNLAGVDLPEIDEVQKYLEARVEVLSNEHTGLVSLLRGVLAGDPDAHSIARRVVRGDSVYAAWRSHTNKWKE